jgi:hypothetical protein
MISVAEASDAPLIESLLTALIEADLISVEQAAELRQRIKSGEIRAEDWLTVADA